MSDKCPKCGAPKMVNEKLKYSCDTYLRFEGKQCLANQLAQANALLLRYTTYMDKYGEDTEWAEDGMWDLYEDILAKRKGSGHE